ncbi:MAG: ribosome maturation factor RimM [Hyphomicrobiaceae bacterium]|nr:ribosome maturation factor RimM [Hyphomicrobiaceae bacterium]MCC0024294.1 ribosome maturation factor RimM [Hyphomicrobiaceae bacterium]
MAERPRNKDLVLMGRIGAAHGIKGEVRIKSHTEDPADIAAYGPLTDGTGKEQFEIVASRLSKGMVIARLKGVTDRNQAERLNGTDLYVARAVLGATENEDEFLQADLIGLEVREPDGRRIGQIKAILNYGASDILDVSLDEGGTALFPFTRAIVPDIFIEHGFVTLVAPEETVVEQDGE